MHKTILRGLPRKVNWKWETKNDCLHSLLLTHSSHMIHWTLSFPRKALRKSTYFRCRPHLVGRRGFGCSPSRRHNGWIVGSEGWGLCRGSHCRDHAWHVIRHARGSHCRDHAWRVTRHARRHNGRNITRHAAPLSFASGALHVREQSHYMAKQ